jgi:hypothetical protein
MTDDDNDDDDVENPSATLTAASNATRQTIQDLTVVVVVE